MTLRVELVLKRDVAQHMARFSQLSRTRCLVFSLGGVKQEERFGIVGDQ